MDAHFPPSPPAITRECDERGAGLHRDMKRHGYPRDFRRALLSDLRRVDGCSREKVRITVSQFRLDWPQYDFAPFLGFVMLINPYVYASPSSGYQIARSLRFNSADTAYLSRTFGTPTTQNTFTVSFWVKRCSLGVLQNIFGVSTNNSIGFPSADTLAVTLAGSATITTTGLFRDPIAWGHVVYKQTTGAAELYCNGVSVGTSATVSAVFNTAVAHQIGAANTSNYLNAYLADFHFIDGQALSPTSFGEFDVTSGAWNPIAYAGTYGTNGFHLDFSDNSNTTAATLGADSSGNGNNWTPNNFSVSAGVGNDSLTDTPTNYGTDTGAGGEVGGNYATFTTLDIAPSNIGVRNGGLNTYGTSAGNNGDGRCPFYNFGTSGPGGKWLVVCDIVALTTNYPYVGLMPDGFTPTSSGANHFPTMGYAYNAKTGALFNKSGSSFATFTALTAGSDAAVIAIDADAQKIWFGCWSSGALSWYNGGNPAAGTNPTINGYTDSRLFLAVSEYNGSETAWNFGQRAFPTTMPSGFKALCTQNLPDPDILLPSTGFDINLRTGTGAGPGFIAGATGTAIGTYTSSGGLSSAFDGNLAQNSVTGPVSGSSALHAVGKNWGSARAISSAELINNNSGTDYVMHGLGAVSVIFELRGSNSNDYTTATVLGTLTATQVATSNYVYTITATDTTAYQYHWITVRVGAGTSATSYVGEARFYDYPATGQVSGLSFQPDLYIGKGRSGATDWAWYDDVRGVQKQLKSNTTTDESTETTGLTAFNSDGISIGALAQINTSSATYVDYFFREGPTYGMDIVSYTGNGANRTISHDLGVVPELIIVKARTTAGADTNWAIYHKNNTTAPETDYLLFTTAATADLNTFWNDTAPTSSVFSVGTAAEVNTNSDTYIAYLFASVTGLSKVGYYTGNGSADGPFVYCGFKPRFIMLKRTDSSGDWYIWDTARDTYNAASKELLANSTAAEAGTADIDILSNGFKPRATTAGFNATSGNYVFLAFAEVDGKFSRAA